MITCRPSRSVRLLLLLLALGVAAPSHAAEPVLIAAGKQPRVGVGADGTIQVLYGAGQALVVRTSRDGGATFAPAVTVGRVAGLLLGMRRGPQLAAGDGVLVAAGIGADGDISAWRSADGGATWSGPVTINDRPKAAREGLFSLAAGARGTVWATWLDLRDGGTRVQAAHSADGGERWTPNVLVYRSPDGSVCECCQPQVAADAAGGVAFMWRNQLAGARDMYLRTSKDGGQTLSTAVRLGSGTWPLNACPMDGGGLAIAGRRVETVWRRQGLMFATGGDPARESNLGPGKNGAVVLPGGTAVRVWQANDAIMLASGERPAVVIGKGAYPALAAISGTDGAVVVAWEAPDGVRVTVVR